MARVAPRYPASRRTGGPRAGAARGLPHHFTIDTERVVIWHYYTEALDQPPAPWPVSGRTRLVTKHTFGLKAFGRYLVITWVWTP